jgi:flagellar protein FlbD
MIHLTRINRVPLVVNSDLIEHVEVTPDTILSLTTGQKFVVRESADEVIHRIIEFRRAIRQSSDSEALPEVGGHGPAEPSTPGKTL